MDPAEHIHRIAEGNQRWALAKYQADSQRSLEATRAGNNAASEAIKAATLINAGAAVAVLAFIGHISSSPSIDQAVIASLTDALRGFVVGTLAAAMVSILTYFTQESFITKMGCEFRREALERESTVDTSAVEQLVNSATRWRRTGMSLKWLAIAIGVLSLLSFVWSAIRASEAFKQLRSRERVVAYVASLADSKRGPS